MIQKIAEYLFQSPYVFIILGCLSSKRQEMLSLRIRVIYVRQGPVSQEGRQSAQELMSRGSLLSEGECFKGAVMIQPQTWAYSDGQGLG